MYGCEDESKCRGYNYGVNCKSSNRNRYVPPEFLCDGSKECDSGEDETGCLVSENENETCTHSKLSTIMNVNKTVPILSSTRCSVLGEGLHSYCVGYLEQTNCSDVGRIAGQCNVNGFRTTISNYVMCDFGEEQLPGPVKLCDDGLESACVEPSSSSGCKVHKHKMCNGENDCPDGSDEVHDNCTLMTGKFQCERLFYSKTNGSIDFPISWILDNVTDCKNGEDEKEDSDAWKICWDENNGQKLVKLQEEKCSDVFYCPGNGQKRYYVEFQHLCDGVESCGTHGRENDLCYLARDFPVVNTRGTNQESVLNLCDHSLECSIKQFRRKFGEVFGVLDSTEMELKVPTDKVNCRMMFGEYYVYLSCLGLCLDVDTICPLTNKPLRHNSCPNQFPDRIYTLANNSYLTFALKSQTDLAYHQPNLFQCNNSKCIEFQHVCNLVDDCGDFSDEANCKNHAVCQENEKHLISFAQVCDGIYDCFDLSDECNELCGREILGHWTLKCICWIMGILAVIFNTLTVFKGVLSLNELRNKTSSLFILFNKSLVTLIGSGDFLIGVYLITLSIYDSIVFGRDYCRYQAEWLTGTTCSVLGVLSTVGSQVSLFAMTVLSVIRVIGVFKRTLTLPRKLDKNAIILAGMMILSIAAISLAVAVLPLIPSFEDYFVQGVYHDPSYRLFIGFPNKMRHVRVLQEYYKNDTASNSSNHNLISRDIPWREIGEKVDAMFSQQHGSLSRKFVHFYGNDGVCLFKYFVRTDDARRSRNASPSENALHQELDVTVWSILALNLLCFVIITVSYIALFISRRKASTRMKQDHNPKDLQQKRTLQRRIALIIATDFLCWIPFIIVSGLHNLTLVDASVWYLHLTMILLPLNSVVNPLIYDDTVKTYVWSKLRTFAQFTRNSKFSRFIIQRWQTRISSKAKAGNDIEIRFTKASSSRSNQANSEQADREESCARSGIQLQAEVEIHSESIYKQDTRRGDGTGPQNAVTSAFLTTEVTKTSELSINSSSL